jgi:hypothetical protein
MEKKEQTQHGTRERTTGEGAKENVSRSQGERDSEEIRYSNQIDESQKNQLEQEDAGTGLGGDRKQKRG